ncbi:hypothetical protein [Haloglycomyces albus]|uniref:hypothetical protein n=1 Tax=Haloglycomyces albus TaxID=526067 RepID=UPI00046C9009|nr:hypothetical protein [Haloglycomyces albus]
MASGNFNRRLMGRTAALAIAAAAGIGLSACGAGLNSQTEIKQSAVAGINADAGPVSLRDLQVEFDSPEGYAEGDNAALRVWLGIGPDSTATLTDVTTDAADDVTFVSADAAEPEPEQPEEEPADETEGEGEEDGETADEEQGDGETADDAAENDANEGTDQEDAEDGTQEGEDAEGDVDTTEEDAEGTEDEQITGGDIDITLEKNGFVRLDKNSLEGDQTPGYLQLEGLNESLASGQDVEVTFTFDITTTDRDGETSESTETITLNLPVGQATQQEEAEHVEAPGMGGH